MAARQRRQPRRENVVRLLLQNRVACRKRLQRFRSCRLRPVLVDIVDNHGQDEFPHLRPGTLDVSEQVAELRLHCRRGLILLHVLRAFLLTIAAERREDGRQDVDHVFRAVKVRDLAADQLPRVVRIHGAPLRAENAFRRQFTQTPEDVR